MMMRIPQCSLGRDVGMGGSPGLVNMVQPCAHERRRLGGVGMGGSRVARRVTVVPYSYSSNVRGGRERGFEGDVFGLGESSQVAEDADFVDKLKAAWRIFFPEKKRRLTPKEEGKKRLRMILVADRCGMSSDSLADMRESIVKAMSDFVEVEAGEAVEVNMSMDPEVGTIYSVAVPVKRVKSRFRPPMGDGDDTMEIAPRRPVGMWDPSDPNSDPSGEFPFGT